MIIDDDADDRMFFKEALKDILPLWVCLEAFDGIEALNQLRKTAQIPSFIFLDMNMPRMDGRECLRELKQDATLKAITVIMYSTSFTEQNRIEFHALGALSCLSKPTDLNKLPEQILKAIRIPIPLS